MDKDRVKKQAEYWFLTAEHDHDTMLGLFKLSRYSDALFYGHIVLEKILKALAVINNSELERGIRMISLIFIKNVIISTRVIIYIK